MDRVVEEDCKCYGSSSESDLKRIEETASCAISIHSSFLTIGDHSLPRLVSILLDLAQDALQFLLLGTRSSATLKAGNIFLRKQLAGYSHSRERSPVEFSSFRAWRAARRVTRHFDDRQDQNGY